MDRKRLYWFAGVLVLTVVAWIMVAPDYIGLCPSYGEDGFYSCVDKYITIAEPSALVLSVLFVAFLFSLFVDNRVFRAWKKFTFIVIPVIVVVIGTTSEYGSTFIDFDRELATWWLSGVYLVISIFLIVYKSWRLKKSKLTYSSRR